MTTTDRRAGDRRSRTDRCAGCSSHKVIDQLLHDARQQAATISALIQIIEPSRVAGEDETLHLVSHAAMQLVDLLEHPRGGRAVEVLQLWGVVQDLVVAARTVGFADIEVDVDVEAMIAADPILVRRATGNLLDNAIRSAGACGHVRFCIEQDAQAAYLIVEDSGPGFGQAPTGRSSLGLGVVFEFLGSVHGTFEIHQSDLGGALLSLSIPRRVDQSSGGTVGRVGLVM